MDTSPTPAAAQSEVSDLRTQCEQLRQLVSSLLLILIVVSGTLSIFLLRQWRFVHAELSGMKPAAASSSMSRMAAPQTTPRLTRYAKYARFSRPLGFRPARSTCGATRRRGPRSPASSSIIRNLWRRRGRAGSGLAISDRPTNPVLLKISLTGISAVLRSAISRPWWTTPLILCSRAAKHRPMRRAAQ